MSGSCCVDVGAKQTHTVQGHEEKIAGLNTYKTGEGKSVIVIFTDIFGYSFINTRKIADTFSQATGTTVLIPDFFDGDPMDATVSTPVLFSRLPEWLKKHPVDQASASSDKFILSLKDHYQSIQVKRRRCFLF
jgi:dienelactone hydrolase